MIRNIRDTEHSEVVVAYGPRFDLDKVMDHGFAVLQVFLSHVKLGYPEAKPVIRCMNDGRRWEPLVPEEYFRMRAGFVSLQSCSEKGFDSGEFGYLIRVGPYRIVVGFLGRHGLYRYPEHQMRTIDGLSGEGYDPTPEICISNSRSSMPLLNAPEAEYAHAALSSYIGKTLELGGPQPQGDQVPAMLLLRFPHAQFGNGEGEIRIGCTTVDI